MSGEEMRKLELLKIILKQRRTTAAEEIYVAVTKTISEYQDKVNLSKEENDHLQRLLDIILKPEIKLYRADFEKFTVCEDFSPVNQECILGHVDRKSNQVKEEPEDLQINQVDQDYLFNSACVKSTRTIYRQYQTQSPQTQGKEYINRITQTEWMKTELKQEHFSKLSWNSQSLHKSKRYRVQTEKGKKSFRLNKSMYTEQRVSPHRLKKTCIQTRKRKDYSSLSERRSTKQGGMFFLCRDCGESFTQIGKLYSHKIREHSAENLYHCNYCGKSFVQRGYLENHMKIHTAKSLYQCHICGKGFVYGEGLKHHMRIHTREKGFD